MEHQLIKQKVQNYLRRRKRRLWNFLTYHEFMGHCGSYRPILFKRERMFFKHLIESIFIVWQTAEKRKKMNAGDM